MLESPDHLQRQSYCTEPSLVCVPLRTGLECMLMCVCVWGKEPGGQLQMASLTGCASSLSFSSLLIFPFETAFFT